jgi:tRNA threonylcarbamoyladenosine biosynthesis protein TsaB
MMKILAIDTSTDACSAALLIDNQIYTEHKVIPRAHTRLILPMIEKVLSTGGCEPGDLDAIAFGCGPGAFTGLRIATGVTQGIALAADKPVIPVSTLAAIALQTHKEHQATHILAALDARMQEIYWGIYQCIDGELELLGDEALLIPANLPDIPELKDKNWVGTGSGWQAYHDVMMKNVAVNVLETYETISPSAKYIVQLAAKEFIHGNLLDPEQAQPVYLRNKVAETLKERGIHGT